MAGGGGGGGEPLPTCISCPVDEPLDDDVALAADVVEELRIDCSSCCMIEELLRLETLKAISPGAGGRARSARNARPCPGRAPTPAKNIPHFSVLQR